jgi:RNA polymerase sigma-70 factor (ECF subfamily)
MSHSLCCRLTGSMEDAQDLVQETFIQAYQHLAEFRGKAKVSSWLYRLAVNRCLLWRRRRQRQGQTHQEWSQQGSKVAFAGLRPDANPA